MELDIAVFACRMCQHRIDMNNINNNDGIGIHTEEENVYITLELEQSRYGRKYHTYAISDRDVL